jgi:hypothetical protein
VTILELAQNPLWNAGEGLYYIHTKQTQMRTTHRFDTFKEALVFLMNELQLSNQEATHFIWDNNLLWEPCNLDYYANLRTGTNPLAVLLKIFYIRTQGIHPMQTWYLQVQDSEYNVLLLNQEIGNYKKYNKWIEKKIDEIIFRQYPTAKRWEVRTNPYTSRVVM